MTTSLVAPEIQNLSSIKARIDTEIDTLVAALPDPKSLTAEQRRGIIARYSAVLEGNFIYWMTAAYLSVRSEEARPILIDNLREEIGRLSSRDAAEIRDCRACVPRRNRRHGGARRFDQGSYVPGAAARRAERTYHGFF